MDSPQTQCLQQLIANCWWGHNKHQQT